LSGITGSLSSEWVAGFAPDYPHMQHFGFFVSQNSKSCPPAKTKSQPLPCGFVPKTDNPKQNLHNTMDFHGINAT